jgi:hypothetical protein
MADELFEGIDDGDAIEKEKERIRGAYRFAFAQTEIGVEVLCDILTNLCHFGQVLETPDDVAQYNVGIGILSRLGVVSKGNEREIVVNLLNVIPKKEG